MKTLITILCISLSVSVYSQEKNDSKIDFEKDKYGIRIDAPKGVYQYAFRIGEWESAYKSLISRYEWKADTGSSRVYVADNGLTFIEEILDKEGNIESKTTYDYDEETDSWNNSYEELKTGKVVKYTSKVVDGNMVETINREDSTNNNTYTIVADNINIYTAIRTYNNGFKIVTHVGIATKKHTN